MHLPIKKRKTSVSRNAEDVDTGASGSMTAPIETNSIGSSSSPMETINSASSSVTASIGSRYEVFLSFRGPDTRYGFTDHLYNGLLNAGIDAFKDDDELCQGENIRPKLMEAIANSKILIPILSVTYGASSWCLDELVQIMERKNNNGQIVLPIFYKVKPADVRHQIGSFGDAFHEHERRLRGRPFNPTILEKWKKALNEASALKGYEANGYEAKLVQEVVQKALSELKKKFELVISENLVGIDWPVNKILEFVDNKSNATLFIGIHGMGGIGKTTLAKIIYNKLSSQFEHRSFIADIRESWKRNGVHYIQNQLIHDILKQENGVRNEDEGTKFISSRFKGKKVLILLDDVDEVIHLKRLAGNHDWFSLGSKIIITTRNKGVFEEARVDYNYEHEVLDNNQSSILFSKHAFRKDSPLKEFEDLTREVVSITKGLPLSLEVLGSLLCGKKLAFWRGTIDKLKKVPPKEVQEKLRISIDALEDGQKQIFLDIACFFIGTNKNIVFYMWDACHFYPGEGIEILIFRSLIKVGNDDELIMHDQLRDLGREIVHEEDRREPWCRSRLWDYEEVQNMLKSNKGTDKIEGINLSRGSSDGSNKIDIYTEKQFKNLTRLRFLRLQRAHLSGDFKDLMKELRWLQWPNCPINFEVNNFHVKELAVLELRVGKMNEKWEGWSFFMMAEKLKYLDLTCCFSLEEDTDFLSAFKKLEVLILNSCHRLKRISASIGDMEALLRLELSRCQSLTELPAEIGNLKALQQLILEHTYSLSTLPDSVGDLENLEILDISHSGIEELPNGIGRLRNLRELRAICSNLQRIMAKSMCDLFSLQRLYFTHCDELQSLPILPSGLIDLCVTCLSRELPSLSHLSHLKVLRVSGCKFLECIQMLPSTLLKNSECSRLMDVEESKSPRSLNTPFKLEILTVYSCHSIEIVDVSPFIHLKILSIGYCKNLLEVRGLDRSIYSFERLDHPKFEGLKKLNVSSCKKLAEIQGLDRLEFLESLVIYECTSIGRLDLPKSRSLTILRVQSCKKLAEIQGLERLEFLKGLNISSCTSIERLLLPKSESLKILEAQDCENLVEIRDLNRLKFLEVLNIIGCKSLKTIPELSGTQIYCGIADRKTIGVGLDFGKYYSDESI